MGRFSLVSEYLKPEFLTVMPGGTGFAKTQTNVVMFDFPRKPRRCSSYDWYSLIKSYVWSWYLCLRHPHSCATHNFPQNYTLTFSPSVINIYLHLGFGLVTFLSISFFFYFTRYITRTLGQSFVFAKNRWHRRHKGDLKKQVP